MKPAERLIPWPGYTGEISITERLSLPGKVHADDVWRAARRRQLEVLHRPDRYQITQSGAVRTVTRGDLVMVNHHRLGSGPIHPAPPV